MKIHQFLRESSDQQVIDTAQRMVKNYTSLSYTPYDRAVDHAISYESNQPQYHYWMAVAQEILRLESQQKSSRKP